MHIVSAIILLGFIVFCSGCIYQNQAETVRIYILTSTATIQLNAEIADDAAERSAGLMNRANLPENGGMLFVFENEERHAFWMKDTLIPLDILFIDSAKKIVDIQAMIPCTSSSCKLYRSSAPAKYALEVNAGFVSMNGIRVGDKILL
jgi:uncharacterized membrane protein (UPF0127 family)